MTMKTTRTLPKLRLTMLFLCTVGLGTVAMHAQDAPPPPDQTQGPPPGGQMGGAGRGGMGGERQIQMMTKQLNLTPDQVTKVKAIDADNMQQMMALRNDTSTAQSDKRSKMMSLRQDRETKIKALLTDDQKSKYDEMQAKMRERRMEHQGEGNGDAPPPPPPAPQD